MKYFSSGQMPEKFDEIKQAMAGMKSWIFEKEDFWACLSGIPRQAKFIDLGCGGGLFADRLIKFGFNDIFLADIDDYRSYAKGKPFFKADLSFAKLPFADQSFDAVASFQTIEHLENPYNFLREANRILKPGGLLIISMPNGWNIYSRLKFLFRNKIEGYHKSDFKTGKLHNHIAFIPRDIFKMYLGNYTIEKAFYRRRKRPGFWIFAKFKVWHPESEFFSDKLCYFLRKNSEVPDRRQK